MKWTLYIQCTGGRQIDKPKPLPGVSLDEDVKAGSMYAIHTSIVAIILKASVHLHRDGIMIEGLEERNTNKGKVYFYQRWWLTPEKE